MPWYNASRKALRSSTTSIGAAGDLGEPSSSLNVRSFNFLCFMMIAVVVVAAEFVEAEECVVVVVLVLTPLALAAELLWVSMRSSFMARFASSVSVALVAAVVGDRAPPLPDVPDVGEVGEVASVGDLRGIGISRSIAF